MADPTHHHVSAADQLSKLAEDELAAIERRQSLIVDLANLNTPTSASVQAVATELGLSPRWVRALLARYRESDGDALSLLPAKVGRRIGRRMLSKSVEDVIAQVLTRRFANRQRPSFKHAYMEVRQICLSRGLPVPSPKTVAARVNDLDPVMVARRRHGENAAQNLKPSVGQGPTPEHPLHIVQMDHTKVDVILVDSLHREGTVRPWLSLGIDLYSRCIAGYYVSLEAPSATVVGICLTSIAEDKEALLFRHGIDASWPIAGKPTVLHTDNGSDFTSRALRIGCATHGIKLEHRPVARAWYGGVVERVIGTFMRMVHDELPGTTRSNAKGRGDYPAEKLASLTLKEFEHWLLLAIVEYHASIHKGIGEPPIEKLRHGLERTSRPTQVKDPKAYLIDFLPMVKRHIGRGGFQINHIAYYDTKLDYYIARRGRWPGSFEIRRDPRSLRYVWVKRPDGPGYMELCYRHLTNPDLTEWEYKLALRDLKEGGQRKVDEGTIMRTAERRKKMVRESSLTSKRARRNNERLMNLGPHVGSRLSKKPPCPPEEIDVTDIKPFEELEVDW